MNSENLQRQIDKRCPCFSKPLEECDCQPESNLKSLGIQQGLYCKCRGYWHIATCICPESIEEYLAMQGEANG